MRADIDLAAIWTTISCAALRDILSWIGPVKHRRDICNAN